MCGIYLYPSLFSCVVCWLLVRHRLKKCPGDLWQTGISRECLCVHVIKMWMCAFLCDCERARSSKHRNNNPETHWFRALFSCVNYLPSAKPQFHWQRECTDKGTKRKDPPDQPKKWMKQLLKYHGQNHFAISTVKKTNKQKTLSGQLIMLSSLCTA